MVPCTACGSLAIETQHVWDICPVYFWECDVRLYGRDDVVSSAKGSMSRNVVPYGASAVFSIHPR
ncbi:CPCC family cysteine-rich protein [Tuwongella immobilis]|uniref:CPCC family cysteine-rich protein n=1 Tax=Tuwongella immobilis TaxID=692036 RepID=UPI0013A6C750